jgi:hypothetical protein
VVENEMIWRGVTAFSLEEPILLAEEERDGVKVVTKDWEMGAG